MATIQGVMGFDWSQVCRFKWTASMTSCTTSSTSLGPDCAFANPRLTIGLSARVNSLRSRL